MVAGDDDPNELESRPPTIGDLVSLCRGLNEAGARYMVVGGMAMIQLGFVRATEDIDLLIPTGEENFERVATAMRALPDRAIDQVTAADLEEFVVVRVADEIVVDLMTKACGIDFDEAQADTILVTVADVAIPFASPQLMWKLKQTFREKDAIDRQFLARLLASD